MYLSCSSNESSSITHASTLFVFICSLVLLFFTDNAVASDSDFTHQNRLIAHNGL